MRLESAVTSSGVLSIKSATLLAFLLTFGVWLLTGYGLTHRTHQTRSQAATVTTRYMDAQQLLANVNSQVLLASVHIRDTLLGAQTDGADSRAQVEQAFDTVDRTRTRYVPVLDTESERARLSRLRDQIKEYRGQLSAVLTTAESVSATEARFILWRNVVPRRDIVISVSEEIRGLNREAFIKHQNDVAEIYESSQRWFWATLIVAILASFGIALVAVRYAGRLEGRLEDQLKVDAANAMELQRLSARLISAQEEERRSIARDLHDEVGQGLTAIKVELAVAERAIGKGSAGAKALEDARTITDSALATVRDLSQLLHPAILDDLGLSVAVETFVRSFGQRHQLKITLDQEDVDTRLAPDVETAIYRIIQESLTNVARHARATACRVSLAWRADQIRLEIEDNGVGMPAAHRPRGPGLGLVGIRERALQLGGIFAIEQPLTGGTRLTITVPATAHPRPDG